MKWSVPVLAGLVFFFACSPSHEKPSTSTDPVPVISQLDSMIEWRNTDKGYYKSSWGFTYDANGRLSTIEGPSRDTAPDGYLNPAFNVIYSFTYNGSDTTPSAYSIQYNGLNVIDEPTEYHLLRLAGEVLASDTLHSTTQEYNKPFTEFSDFSFYKNKAYRVASDSGPEDTIYFDKGNMIVDSSMGIGDDGQRYGQSWQQWDYGMDQNPLFIPSFQRVRLAFFFNFYQDFGSPNVVTVYKFTNESREIETWTYVWTKDTNGRINGGTAIGGSNGKVQDQILFSYKK